MRFALFPGILRRNPLVQDRSWLDLFRILVERLASVPALELQAQAQNAQFGPVLAVTANTVLAALTKKGDRFYFRNNFPLNGICIAPVLLVLARLTDPTCLVQLARDGFAHGQLNRNLVGMVVRRISANGNFGRGARSEAQLTTR